VKRTSLILICLILILNSTSFTKTRYFPPASDRSRISLDLGWRFFRGDINGEEETHQVNQRAWKNVNLPHEWSIEGPFSPDNNTTQGFLPMEIGWYRKALRFPENYEGKKIYIVFDGVYRECDVWMNYAYLGHHVSGYTSFAYDITDYVRTGNRTPNGLRVRVDGRRHEQDMYEGTGIYRHVWLVVANKLHIANWGTFVSTPKVTRKEAEIKIQTKIKNDYSQTQSFKLTTQIVNNDGQIVAEISNNYSLEPNSVKEFTQNTKVEQPHLWELENPYLYKAYSSIQLKGETIDTYETRFGIRTFHFDADAGFFLNGKHLKLQGFCAHYDFPVLGTAIPDRIQRDAMIVMKKAGFNLFRSSHNPASPQRLDFCDELGILVWDEIERKLESKEIELPLVRETITQHRNHPSIILWSLENESPLESTTFGANIMQAGTELAYQLDPTRLTTFAASMPVNKNGYGAAVDVVSYNYHWERADQDHLDFPEWKIGLISEYSAKKTRRGVYGIDKQFDLFEGEVNTIYQSCVSVEGYWKRIRARDYLGGGCIWAGIDYWGEACRWPLTRSGYGIVDMCFTPKAPYFYFASQWTQTPMIHLFPHWNWKGHEGETIDLWCYTNCDEVELFLNGKSFGSQKRVLDLTAYKPVEYRKLPPEKRSHHFFDNPALADKQAEHLSWQVPYTAGTLKAIGKRTGKVVCKKEITTAGKPAQIKLQEYMASYLNETEKFPLIANGRDIVVVKAAILDHAGHLVPKANNLIKFEVEGKEKILGVGNGDIASQAPNQSNIRKAFNGYCIVLVQATAQPSEFKIKASSEGLISGEIKIKSRPPQPKTISLNAKPYHISRGGEISDLEVAILDKFGDCINSAQTEIVLTISGPVTFQNAQKTLKITVKNGKSVLKLKSGKTAGRAIISAKSAQIPTVKSDVWVK